MTVTPPHLAFAATAADRPAGSLGCTLISTLASDDAGKPLAAIVITVLNVGALLGKVPWSVALLLATAVTLVFGAATLVSALDAGTRGYGCPC